jgi:hypothetical protein
MNRQDLSRFARNDIYYTFPNWNIRYTEGVKFIAEEADADWLVDVIGSYQSKVSKIESCRERQIWTLTVEDHKGKLVCRADDGKPPVVEHRVDFTEFPLSQLTLWVEDGVVLLPSEH